MRREWTEWEVRYLEKKYVGQPVERTAKKLNRTINSVKRKAAKLDLNHYTNFLSAKVVAKCFNVDTKVVLRWINKFNLPCKKVVCSNQTRYLIDGNIIKYICRWKNKNGLQDLEKAQWYLSHLIEHIKKLKEENKLS